MREVLWKRLNKKEKETEDIRKQVLKLFNE